MSENKSSKWLYDELVSNGYNVGKDFNEFNSLMTSNEESRKWAFDTAQGLGYNVGKDFDEFNALINPVVEPVQKASEYVRNPYTAKPSDYSQKTEAQKAFEERGDFEPIGQGTVKLNDREVPVVVGAEGEMRVPSPVALDKEEEVFRHGFPSEAEQRELQHKAQSEITGQVGQLKNKIGEKLLEKERETQRSFPMPAGGVAGGMLGMSQADMVSQSDKETAQLRAAYNLVNDTQAHIDKVRRGGSGFFSSLGRSMAEKAGDPRTWDFGLTDMKDSTALLGVVDKAEKGEKLTDAEQMLLDASVNNALIQAYFNANEMSKGEMAGETTVDMIPFMAQILVNPLSGVGRAAASKASKAVARYINKNIIQKGALATMVKKVLPRAAAFAVGVGGDLVGGTGMAVTTNAMRTVADANKRQLNGDSAGKAWKDAILGQGIEFASENTGRFFEPVFGGIGKALGKGAGWTLGKLGAGKVVNLAEDIAKKANSPQLKEFFDNTQWHGFFGEYGEEIAGGLMNAAMVGDQTAEEVFSKENLFDTAVGLSVASVLFPAVSTVNYGVTKYNERAAALSAETEAKKVFGERWQAFKDAITGAQNNDELGKAIEQVYQSEGVKVSPKEEVKALYDYATKYYAYNALKNINPTGVRYLDDDYKALDEAYISGQALQGEEKQNALLEANRQLGELERLTGMSADELGVINDDECLARAEEADASGEFELAEVWRNYAKAGVTMAGVSQSYNDAIAQQSAVSDAEVDAISNKEGAVVSATLRGGEKVNIVGGNIAFNDDGSINDELSDKQITIIENGTKRVVGITSIASVDATVSADEEKVNRRTAIEESVRRQQRIDLGEEHVFTPGEKFASLKGEEVEFISDNGDGTAMVLVNGKENAVDKQALNDMFVASRQMAYNAEKTQQPAEVPTNEVASEEVAPATALERVPKDENGEPIYEQVDSDTAWDAIVEQTEGDVEMAQAVANGMVADKEVALKKLEKAKSKGGVTIAEKIAAEKERKAKIEAAKQELAKWQEIAGVAASRKAAPDINDASKTETVATEETKPAESVEAPAVEEVQATNEMQPVEEHPTVTAAEEGRDTVGGSPVALAYLLEGGKGSILNAGYFLHGVAAAFPAITNEIEALRNAMSGEVLGMGPMDFATQRAEEIAAISELIEGTYGEEGLNVFSELLNNADGFYPRGGQEVAARIEALHPIEEQGGEEAMPLVDNQGNPIDTNGKLVIEEVSSIDEITDEDFEAPTRNVQLPAIPENVANVIGTEGRSVIIKKNVFLKNGNTHVELEPADSRAILKSALYNPNLVGSTQPIKRPDYKVAIRTGEKNAVVVLDVFRDKEHVEIVGWRLVNEKGLAKMQRQAEREGGQFLILSPNDGAAAALSALPLGLSSTAKDTPQVSNEQENEQKSGEKVNTGVNEGVPENAETVPTEAENRTEPTKKVEESSKSVLNDGLQLIEAPTEVTEFDTADEFVAGLLGGIKITPESFRKETGLGIDEQRKLVGIIAGEDKGGVSVERASEIIAENYAEELAASGFHGDVQDIRNMLIDILSSGNPKTYIKQSKERRAAEWVEQETARADAWAEERFGFASYADMLMYEETALKRIEEKYRGFDEQEYFNILAENYNYDTRRESERVGNGSEVLQGERAVPSPRTENIGERNEGAEVRYDVQGGDKTADAQEQEVVGPVERIEDVGEKIGGAKKDKLRETIDRMKADMEQSDETLIDKIAKLPISKIFNFDFQKLREGGMPNEAISFMEIVKKSIPAKPRTSHKVRRWVNNTLALYKLCLEVGTNWDKVNTILTSRDFAGTDLKAQFDAYMSIGGFDSGLNIGNAKLKQLDKTAGYYKDGKFISSEGKWYVRDAGKHGGIYDTKEDAVEALKAFAGDNAGTTESGKKKEVKFAVYQRREDKSIFIAIKGKSDIVIQDGFKSAKEAFDYIGANNAELQSRYRNLLDKTNADFEENRERKGRDYRNGKDITAEEFRNTFGFRGVEFGNWMTQEDRRKAINECYDALMDLAAVCKVSPKALSLNGTLGMAFGSRGGGKFSAHYEPGKVVINLTKTRGAGTLAHEWFHAIDNYFAKMGETEYGYATGGEGMLPKGIQKYGKRYYDRNRGRVITEEEYNELAKEHAVRREMVDAWEHLMESLKNSDYYKRSNAYARLHNSKYWNDPTELGARAFSVWVENELSKQDTSNDYLANNPRYVKAEVTDAQDKYMPYPFDTDADWMDEAFGNLFEVMQEKETEDGNVVLYRQGEGSLSEGVVVMDSDVYSKALGKTRYYGKKQSDYVARVRKKMEQQAHELAAKLNTPVEVRESADGLSGKKSKAKGWYDVKSGKIVVVVSNHSSVADIQATVLHEVVAHKGLRKLFGERFDTFLDNVYNNVDANIRAEIDALAEKYGNTREATEEYLASLAEDTRFEKVDATLWGRIKQWFLNMLAEAGIKLDFELSDNELRYILWRSYQNLANPGRYNIVKRIEDVAVRARLGIGEYAPASEEIVQVAEEDTAEYTSEEQQIIADAKANGSYMKAPNGQPTKLNEKQWAQVRTANFKKWFGDWEKASRIEKLKKSKPIEITGQEIKPSEDIKQYKQNALEYGKTLRGEYTNADTGASVQVNAQSIKEVLHHDYKDVEHLQSVAAIPMLIERGVYIDTVANEGNDAKSKVKEYQYYVCGLKIGGVDYTVKLVIAVDNNGNRYYDHKLTEIEKSKLLDELDRITSPSSQEENALSAIKDKRLLSILQTNSSKIVDENGEPMVVYHRTPKEFTSFDKEKIGSSTDWGAFGKGFYLSPADFGSIYGENLMSLFVNVKNPLVLNDANAFDVKQPFFSKDYSWRREQSENFTEWVKDSGYDGVWYIEGTGRDEIVAFEPNQMKSASDNTGDFSENENDIRFRERDDVASEENSAEYENAVKTAKSFNARHKGAAPVVVVRSGDSTEEQLAEMGFSQEEIDDIIEIYKKGSGAFYDVERNVVVLLNTNLGKKQLKTVLWHEAVHKVIRDMGITDEQLNYFFELQSDDVKSAIKENLKNAGYEESEFAEEYLAYYIQDMYWNGLMNNSDYDVLSRLNDNATDNNRKQIEFVQPIINSIINGTFGFHSPGNETGGGRGTERGETSRSNRFSGERGAVDGILLHNSASGANAEGKTGVDDDDTLFRMDDAQSAIVNYNRRVLQSSYQAKEALQDSMLSLKEAQEAVVNETGKAMRDDEDAYMAENALSSVNTAEAAEYKRSFYQPLVDEVAAVAKKMGYEATYDYLMAKHGIERNREMSVKEALKVNGVVDKAKYESWRSERNNTIAEAKKMGLSWEETQRKLDALAKSFGATIRDYSGLSALYGNDFAVKAYGAVKDFESKVDTKALIECVKAASKATLMKLYNSSIIDEETFALVSGMYEYYVPLRGFAEKTTDEVYAYLTQEARGMGSVMKVTHGRNSKAENPIAFIGQMAEQAIAQGNRNRMKLRFLNFVLARPTSLFTVTKHVYLHFKDGEWQVETPKGMIDKLPQDATPDAIANAVLAWEKEMNENVKNSPKSYRKVDASAGIPYKMPNKENLSEHQVFVKRAGKTFVITVNGSPRVAQALNGLTNPNIETGVKMLDAVGNGISKLNRFLSTVYTTRNINFVASNFMRDMVYTNSMVWIKESPKYAMRFNKNVLVALKEMNRLFSKLEKGILDMNDPEEKLFAEFVRNGGETGYTQLKDIEAQKKELKKMLAKADRKGLSGFKSDALGKGKDGVNAVKSWLDHVNRSIENVARFAAYKTSREMGRSVAKSIWDAKEISVNFNKKGAGAKFLGANGQTMWGSFAAGVAGGGRGLYVFWNAGIQGIDNIAKAAKNNPAKAATVAATLFTTGILLPILHSVFNGDDEDEYMMLPEYIRRNNICIKIPGLNQFATIPLPIEYRAVYGAGEYISNLVMGKEEWDALKAASLITQLLPIDMLEGGAITEGDFLTPLMPSSVAPFWQAYIKNKSWTGLPVWRDSDFDREYLPQHRRVYKGTSPLLVAFTKKLNQLSGGNDEEKGWLDVNPAKLEHALEGYLGGYATQIRQLTNLAAGVKYAWNSAMGDETDENYKFDTKDLPVLSRWFRQIDPERGGAGMTSQFHEYRKASENTKSLLRLYSKKSVDPRVTDEERQFSIERLNEIQNGEDFKVMQVYEQYRKAYEGLNKRAKEDDTKENRKAVYDLMKEVNREMKKALSE